MHYTAIEEVPAREVVMAGMFLVNKHPTVVLFDSRASHSFMSQAFVSRHDQEIIEVSKGGYNISSAGGTVTTKKIVKKCAHLYTREGVHNGFDNIARVIDKCNLRHELDEVSLCSY